MYADNDPIVLLHARALLSSTPQGTCDYVEADLRDTAAIVRAAARTLDLGAPVALMLLIILHLIPDVDAPGEIVAELMGALPSGSYLVLAHPASDIRAAQMAEMTRRVNERMRGPVTPCATGPRSRASSTGSTWSSRAWSSPSAAARARNAEPARGHSVVRGGQAGNE